MKIRGRRVALLLTGVLPLLAIDDVPVVEDNDNQYSADDARQKSQDAAEKMHDDALTSIPSLQLLDLSSSSYAANVVMVDDFFGDDYEFLDMKNATTRTADERIDHATTTTEVVSKTKTEPVVTTLDVEVATSDEEGDEPVQESSTDETIEEEPAAFDEQSLEEEEQVPVEGAGSAQAETRGEENQEEIVSDETMEEIKEEIMEEIKEEEIKEEGKDQEEEEEEVVSEPVMVDYASKSAGALILESSPSMKGASNLLHSDKDKYAISPCTDKKYVVLGLSEDILVKQIKIANYERYSSHVKSFQIMGSQTMGQWVDLGVFEAGNLGNGEQAFNLMEPSWARYLKFKFNTHYGSEHYCTLSQVRVHGSTMQQGFHEEWKEAEEEKENAAAKAAAAEKAVETVDVSVAKTDGDEVETKAAPVVDLEKPVEATTTGEAPTDDATAETVDDSDDDTATEPAETVEVSPPEVVTVRKVTEQALGTEPAAKLSGLKLPRQLPPIFDIHTAPIPSALARARFESPAHKDMYRPPRIEALNTAAICPAPRRHDFNRVIRDATMKGVTNKTSDAQPQKIDYASTVSNAVRELQSRIQTTLGRTWELQHTIQTMIGKALPDLDEAWRQDAVVSEEGNTEQVTEPEETVNTKAETTPPPQAVAVEKADSKPEAEIAMEERSATSIVEDTAVLDTEMPAGLAAAVARYPSANCLEALNFPAFKKNMMDKVATGNGATGNQPGKMEPVFKTLTLEIKALQISQNVHDQFSRALVTCYQNIMMEMANELHQTKTVQEDRLSNLETEMRQMKSNDWVAQIGSTVVYLMGIFLSLSAIFYTQAFLFIKDTVPVILAMEGGLYILGGLGFVSIIFILLLVRVLRRPPVSHKEE